jgi:menaquinone-specific isochorismate synthase
MGGWPRDHALDFIQTYEQTPRGWYAAPVGWIDHKLDGVFAVAIRSAVVQRNRAWLYGGAGIVADSKPEREWEETGWKFRPILGALGVPEDERGANRGP